MNENSLHEIAVRNQHRNYFQSHTGSETEVELFLNDQARFVKVLVRDLNQTDSFDRLVKKCCDEAHFIYKGNYLNKPMHTSLP